eukprot:CAMPEP_0175980846 /NCGR_PEP_ID=MMETSP0108-20121206/47015_1 /TAXON_ID=195067 ORGANISM="Goniomonas pacifica, Strain CCMP1869" /NCGR_SAMPLE_ID=MMETSP0108 /ASSEMBLY_ACC=CAM_ASM_000204 /LENGTH=195 /DNA_ID=CAMNT_0017311327 /DNA_START=71 /DNA_END=656 /DNA_ORIENTATION=+
MMPVREKRLAVSSAAWTCGVGDGPHSLVRLQELRGVPHVHIAQKFFVVVVGLSIPGATVLSFAGGLFFKQPWATIYSWIGCTIGATLCFCLVRSVIGDFLRRKVSTKSGVFRRFKAGLERNHILYMIFIRYVLVVPFWFVNVAAAVLGVPLGVFMFTTCVAIVPGSLLYTTAGSGLAAIFDDYDPVNMPTSAILW